ncbi:MAG: GlsB/YeaQ/YmgE family stress response membrane protein [Pirellulales bacterium]
MLGFLLLLLIAGVCGGVAQAIVGYSHGGCLVSIALGLIGALLGSWIAGQVGMAEILSIQVGGRSFPVVWSIIGAALFVAVLGLLSRRSTV